MMYTAGMTAKPDKIDTLTSIVERGFAAIAGDISDMKGDIANMKGDIANIKSDIGEIRSVMVTKTEHHALRQEVLDGFQSLREELRDIREQLEVLELKVKDHAGHTKEIDHLLLRVAVIEKHLSINHKIAA